MKNKNKSIIYNENKIYNSFLKKIFVKNIEEKWLKTTT